LRETTLTKNALDCHCQLVSCSGGNSPTPTPTPPPTPAPTPMPTISVSVIPATSQVILGNSASFSAAVTGSTNAAVTWSLVGPGTLDTAGNYTAPADLPSPATATVTATSQASSSVSGSATATVISDLTVSIQTSPAQTTSVALSGTLSLTAAITSKGKPDTAVTWKVNGVAGGNSTVGTITGTAPVTYTAPATLPSAPQVTIVATSTADPSKTASLQVTLGSPTTGGGISVSNSTPIPLTPIAITGVPFAASANTTLTFTDGNSYTFTENPIRVAADGTVIAAVPIYVTSPGVMGSRFSGRVFQNHLLLERRIRPSPISKSEPLAGTLAASFLERLLYASHLSSRYYGVSFFKVERVFIT
jgi:hypothetical protein